jgi:hypothetical protein
MRVHSLLGSAALAATLALPLSARAEQGPSTVAPSPRVASRVPEINLALGFRSMLMPSAGLDPFSTNNAVSQVSFVAGPTLVKRRAFSVAALAEWDFGRLKGTARGNEATLVLHRLGVGLESRFQVARHLAFFAKIAPAAVHLGGSLTDPGFARPLVTGSWSWALDTTAGAAFMFSSTGPRDAPTSRFWLTGELGYGFAGTSDMIYKPEPQEEDPRVYGAIMLPALRPSGALARGSVAVSF